MTETEQSCALTGHRLLEEDFSEQKLKETLVYLLKERKVRRFYCGMALGFDLKACEILRSLKAEFPSLEVVACVPCPEQADKFSEFQRETYLRLLSACEEVVTVSPRYDKGCMHLRNRYMVDRAEFLLAYCRKERGGTASTVRYAKKKNRTILFV